MAFNESSLDRISSKNGIDLYTKEIVSNDNKIDENLLARGDTRNVQDKYRNWTVEAIKTDLTSKSFPLHVAIENYQHDYNIGTIVRSCNAFNVAGIHIVGKRHWNRRGAMSTEKYLELHHHASVNDFKLWADSNNQKIVGIDNLAGYRPLQTTKLSSSTVYVFGQEGPGLSEEMQSICSGIVGIDQFGSTRSLNLGVAAGIFLYEWSRQYDQEN